MRSLLHPIKFDEKFEYEIQKEGQLYVAGIKKVILCPDAKLQGRLYLDELSRETEEKMTFILARPIFPSPDYNPIYSVTKEKRRNVIDINPVIIDEELNEFFINIQLGLKNKYKSKMNEEDIDYFFRGIHQHYIKNQ